MMRQLSKEEWIRSLEGIRAEFRDGQYDGAKLIADLSTDHYLCIEAPTGTGKTLMYLISGLHRGDNLLISTSTKILQSQLKETIQNQLCRALGRNVTFAVLKGRNNYICQNMLQFYLTKARELPEKQSFLQKIREYSHTHEFIDLDEVTKSIKFSSNEVEWIQRLICSDSVACLRGECRELAESKSPCTYEAVKKHAEKAEIIITNHHCFLTLAKNNLELNAIWGPRLYIFDEAHLIDPAAEQVFTVQATSQSCDELLDRFRSLLKSGDSKPFNHYHELEELVQKLKFYENVEQWIKSGLRLFERWGTDGPLLLQDFIIKSREFTLFQDRYFKFRKTGSELTHFIRNTLLPSLHSKSLLYVEFTILVENFKELTTNFDQFFEEGKRSSNQGSDSMPDTVHGNRDASIENNSPIQNQENPTTGEVPIPQAPEIVWLEVDLEKIKWKMKRAPIECSDVLKSFWKTGKACVFLSATLTTGVNDFDWFKQCNGIEEAECIVLPNVFNLKDNCRIFIPDNQKVMTSSVLQPKSFLKPRLHLLAQLISGFQGRLMGLFSSVNRLWCSYLVLKEMNPPGQILAQEIGQDNSQIGEQFLADEKASLLATRSFFQGFDAPGATLSILFLEKLPFDALYDPILQARMAAAEDRNVDSFETVYLPQMIITLRQAIGRLIRTKADKGIVILADARVWDTFRSYNAKVEQALAPIPLNTFKSISDIYLQLDKKFFPFNWDKDKAIQNIDAVTQQFNHVWQSLLNTNEKFRRLLGEFSQEDVLKRLGIERLYDWQKPIIDGILAKDPKFREQLVVYPTGSGKSLLYQVPALMQDGLTLVISPLIALMHDQVSALWRQGIAEVTYINSAMSEEVRKYRTKGIRDGRYKLLYVAPERFTGHFIEDLRKTPDGVTLMAVDEAHMVSQVGHDFRPLYTYLGEIREQLQHPFLLALTATASQRVREDICGQFNIQTKNTHIDSIVRKGVRLEVRQISRTSQHYNFCAEIVEKANGKPVLIYCGIKRYAYDLKRSLSEKFGDDKISIYTGELSDANRQMNHQRFFDNRAQVMVATSAYGMGINKPDIMVVVYNNLPLSLEELVQGGGRICRDPNLLSGNLKRKINPLNIILFNPKDEKGFVRMLIDKPLGDQFVRCMSKLEMILNSINNQNFSTIAIPSAGNINDEIKDYYVALQFCKKQGVVKSFHFDWNSCSFQIQRVLHSSNGIKQAFQNHWIKDVKQKKLDAIGQVINYCKTTNQCRNTYLQSYFGEKTDSNKLCHCCDFEGCREFDLAKHEKFIQSVSRTFSQRIPEDELFEGEELRRDSLAIHRYLKAIQNEPNPHLHIELLQRRRQEANDSVKSGYDFLIPLMTAFLTFPENELNKTSAMVSLVNDVHRSAPSFKSLLKKLMPLLGWQNWLPILEWQNPQDMLAQIKNAAESDKLDLPNHYQLLIDRAKALPGLKEFAHRIERKAAVNKFEENFIKRTELPDQRELLLYSNSLMEFQVLQSRIKHFKSHPSPKLRILGRILEIMQSKGAKEMYQALMTAELLEHCGKANWGSREVLPFLLAITQWENWLLELQDIKEPLKTVKALQKYLDEGDDNNHAEALDLLKKCVKLQPFVKEIERNIRRLETSVFEDDFNNNPNSAKWKQPLTSYIQRAINEPDLINTEFLQERHVSTNLPHSGYELLAKVVGCVVEKSPNPAEQTLKFIECISVAQHYGDQCSALVKSVLSEFGIDSGFDDIPTEQAETKFSENIIPEYDLNQLDAQSAFTLFQKIHRDPRLKSQSIALLEKITFPLRLILGLHVFPDDISIAILFKNMDNSYSDFSHLQYVPAALSEFFVKTQITQKWLELLPHLSLLEPRLAESPEKWQILFKCFAALARVERWNTVDPNGTIGKIADFYQAHADKLFDPQAEREGIWFLQAQSAVMQSLAGAETIKVNGQQVHGDENFIIHWLEDTEIAAKYAQFAPVANKLFHDTIFKLVLS